MECVIGLFKTECIRTTIFRAGPYKTIAEVESATAGWAEWYNSDRPHSAANGRPPATRLTTGVTNVQPSYS